MKQKSVMIEFCKVTDTWKAKADFLQSYYWGNILFRFLELKCQKTNDFVVKLHYYENYCTVSVFKKTSTWGRGEGVTAYNLMGLKQGQLTHLTKAEKVLFGSKFFWIYFWAVNNVS